VKHNKINADVVRYQEMRLDEHGPSARGLDWKSEEAQTLLFEMIVDLIPSSGSILDVGCGLAHLFGFLRSRGFEGQYTGVDLSPRLVETARRQHPDLDIREGDMAQAVPEGEMFDHVVASGIFSARLSSPPDEFESYIHHTLERMWMHARESVIFNMLTSYVDFRSDRLYYGSPEYWVKEAARMSRFFQLRHDSQSYFLTLGIYRSAARSSSKGFPSGT